MLVALTDNVDLKIIQISGVVDYAVLADFRHLLFQSMETAAPKVLLDMSSVSCINADGMQIILDMYAQYSQSHDISIINPSDTVNKLLLLTGLNNLMSINRRFHYGDAR